MKGVLVPSKQHSNDNLGVQEKKIFCRKAGVQDQGKIGNRCFQYDFKSMWRYINFVHFKEDLYSLENHDIFGLAENKLPRTS